MFVFFSAIFRLHKLLRIIIINRPYAGIRSFHVHYKKRRA